MSRFDYFVVFAEMRTGSNFLEANLVSLDGILSFGEAYNPSFIGYPDKETILNIDKETREKDPFLLLDAIKKSDGLCGFRFFHNHDERILDHILSDERCAKIILTRNPIESFVSLKIVQETGQWILTNATHEKKTSITFDKDEFEAHLQTLQAFQVRLQNGLQKSGQTAFYLDYDDLRNVEVINGIAKYLGVDSRIENLSQRLKKQNPAPLKEKVQNFEEMEAALARLDRFNLSRTPSFEPRRGDAVPSYIAAATSPVLYLPLKSGPNRAVEKWMADLDDVEPTQLKREFSYGSLREWQIDHEGHRSFTVVRHPVAWAHSAFCEYILRPGPKQFGSIRKRLISIHNLSLPDDPSEKSYGQKAHQKAFLLFLLFLKNNLAAQTSIRVDPAWASQLSLIKGISTYRAPDLILRETNLRRDLKCLLTQLGKKGNPGVVARTDPYAARLSRIYNAEIEIAARDAYRDDYRTFGFSDYAA